MSLEPNATLVLNSGRCCFRFDMSDLLRVEDQQTTNRSLRQCPNFGENLRRYHSPVENLKITDLTFL